jgi:uncharacterized protein (DUF362 family)
MSRVILIPCANYQNEIKLPAIDLSGQKVLIKPNILAPFRVERAATTHPAVVEAVILMVKASGGRPFVGESAGGGSSEYAARTTGILEVCKKHNVPFVDFKTPIEAENLNGKRFKRINIAKEVLDFDCIINVPKWKTHGLTAVTGAVKNMFGCVPGLLKSQYHYKIKTRLEFCDLMLDIHRYFKDRVRLSIMDGVVAMAGEGPSAGDPYPLGLIGISEDQMALDQVFCEVCGIDPRTVPIIECQKDIVVVGEMKKVRDFKHYERFPEQVLHLGLLGGLLKLIFDEKPVILEDKCTKCRTCVSVCASKAISDEIVIDYDKCIRCYCCAEFCPEKAVKIKRNPILYWLNRLVQRLQPPI